MRGRVRPPLIIVAFLALVAVASAWADIAALFPEMEGWKQEGEPDVYLPDNLFEYMDGSAELYLAYDFQEMGTLGYADGRGGSVTVDIYRLGDPRCAYGIYSQERPRDPDYLAVGAQGYHDPGVVNYCQGDYYVKILGYDLASDESALIAVAKEVSASLSSAPGAPDADIEKALPVVLSCFPSKGKVPHSERYLARDFLGLEFLRSAFVAEYDLGQERARAFIIEAADPAEAEAMVERFRTVAVERGGQVGKRDDALRLQDPRQTAGPATLKWRERYIWGVVGGDPTLLDPVLHGLERGLKDQRLLQ